MALQNCIFPPKLHFFFQYNLLEFCFYLPLMHIFYQRVCAARFRLLVVFAHILTFPINIVLTEFAITAYDLMHKVIRKLLCI